MKIKANFKRIMFVFLIVTILSCSTQNKEWEAAKTQEVKKSPAIKSKKPQKIEKPAPVFQPQAAITTTDGKVYEVADFAFYSKHRSFEGGLYTPRSGSTKWFLYLKQGPIWERIDFAKVKSITISKSSRVGWLKIDLVRLDGTKLQGLHPFYAYKNIWYKHGVVYLTGKAEVLGRIGNFKCKIASVLSFEKLAADVTDAPLKFKVIHNIKEKIQTTVTNPEFKLTWEKVTPTYLDVYKLKSNMPVTINKTEIKIKPGEIESVTVPRRSNTPFTVKMKQGEIVKFKLPPRVFGRLENGDILFTYFFEKGKPVVKEIQIKPEPGLSLSFPGTVSSTITCSSYLAEPPICGGNPNIYICLEWFSRFFYMIRSMKYLLFIGIS